MYPSLVYISMSPLRVNDSAKNEKSKEKRPEPTRTEGRGACLRGHRTAVSLLLADPRVDADVVDDEGRSPLADAVRKGRMDVLRVLLEVSPGR